MPETKFGAVFIHADSLAALPCSRRSACRTVNDVAIGWKITANWRVGLRFWVSRRCVPGTLWINAFGSVAVDAGSASPPGCSGAASAKLMLLQPTARIAPSSSRRGPVSCSSAAARATAALVSALDPVCVMRARA